ELRDPVQCTDSGLPGYEFQYGTTSAEADDIACRTLPDGETFRYHYVSGSSPNAGRLEDAELVTSCTATPAVHRWSYAYSEPDDADDGERWLTVTPQQTADSPTLK